jgi:polysaccharide biosynthesis/export protein
MKRNILLMVLACSLSLPIVGRSQDPQPSAPPPVSNPVFTSGTSVDTQGLKNYLLGPGDVIDVRVFGQSDLNAMAEVDSDGNISSLPFLESAIVARCRTEKEIQKDIAAAYSKYLKNPQISVRTSERKSRPPATVSGAVRQPTRVLMMRKVRLSEVMTASGGFTERAAGTIQILHTEPLMCPGPGEEAEGAPLDPEKVALEIVKISDLRAGKPQGNPVIRPGDSIVVTEAEPVYIIGSVWNPQQVYLTDQLTLSRAIAMVGGARKEGKLNGVKIYRTKPGVQDQEVIVVDYNAIKKSQKPDVKLQAYDVIEVPEAGLFSSSRIGTTLLGAATGGLSSMFNAVGPATFQNRTIR